jgi:plasmid stabilization system protein ParE
VPNLVILPFAEAQMADALEYTLVTFGEAKYREYLDLIEAALRALAADPSSGRKRPDIHADAWTYHAIFSDGARRAASVDLGLGSDSGVGHEEPHSLLPANAPSSQAGVAP